MVAKSKIFWFLVFIVGVIGLTVNLVFITSKYLSYPILISTTHEYKNFTWPDLTFCNPSAPFSLENNSLSLQHWQNITRLSEKYFGFRTSEHEIIRRYTLKDDKLKSITMSSIQPSIMYKNLYKQSLMSLVAEVFSPASLRSSSEHYRFRTVSNLHKYVSSLFVLHGYNIPCYTIHANKFEFGGDQYLKLILSIKFNFESHLNFNSHFNPRSVILYVHEPDSIPGGKAINLLPGYQHTLQVTETHNHNLRIRNPCREKNFTVELYDTLFQKPLNLTGDLKDCKNVEMQKEYVKACKCYIPTLPIYKNGTEVPKLCLNATLFNETEFKANEKCMSENSYEVWLMGSIPGQIKQCNDFKHKKCKERSYQIDHNKDMLTPLWLNNSNYFTTKIVYFLCKRFYKNSVVKDDCFLKLKNDYVLLEIGRKSSAADLQFEEREYPVSNLISDIGGLMGLWLGMSVVGLFKIFGLYLKKLYLKIRKTKKPTEIKKRNQDLVEMPELVSNE